MVSEMPYMEGVHRSFSSARDSGTVCPESL
jgi:hypothetical protein